MNATSGCRTGASWRGWQRGGFWGGMMLIAALAAPRAADASTYRWQADASGDWNVPGNWEVVEGPAGAGYPNLAGDVAVFDEPLTALRTVTIPDTVTVTIGRLTVALSPNPARLLIERAGSGLLVFDNLGEDAVIESSGEGEPVGLRTPIELAADVNVNGRIEFSGIGEAGGARNVTITGGGVEYFGANTYTGTTTVTNGSLLATQGMVPVRMVGTLIVGDGTGAAGSAGVGISGDSIDHTADVLVRADGSLSFTRNALLTSFAHTINELTVERGRVSVSVTATSLTVQQAVTMEGGEITIGSSGGGNALHLLGAFNATSTGAGQAVIRGTGTIAPGVVRLGPGNHDFTIANGPQVVDLLIDAGILQTDPGAGMTKLGPGVVQIREASYTGATSVMAGELIVTGDASSSAFTVSNATLSGTGTVGPLTTQAGGRVIPGANPGVGILGSGAANLGGTLAIEINGSTAGTGYDQLKVTGAVTVGGTLEPTGTPVLPPAAVLTIIDNDGSDPVTGTFTGLPEGAAFTLHNTTFAISYFGGDGNDVVLANVTPLIYFLSEGATGTFFDEDVLIANPNTVPAPITMTFFLPGGGTVVQHAIVLPQSRLTVEVDEIDFLQNTSPSVEVRSDNRVTLAVERTMFWDSTHYGGHTANAVPNAGLQWFFAEGSQGFFDTYLLLANPNVGTTVATVTFLLENGSPFVLNLPLPGKSRTTVSAGDHPQLVGQSFGIMVNANTPITAERAMYFQTTPERLWSGGHDNIGSPETSTSWFHPEGASGTFFNTFILMSNPQTTAATVTLRFLLADGTEPIEITKTIQPQARLTVNPATEGITRLQNAAFSTVVTSDVAIVSERAMYWPGDDVPLGEGHASSGLTSTADEWVLAEGRVGGPNAYTTYILLANPNSSVAAVTVTYLRESGAPVVETYEVAANSRFNIDVGAMVPELQNESFGALIEVTNDVPIAVERSMYWNVEGRFWSGGTNAVGAVVPR